MSRREELADGLAQVRGRIERACVEAGRDASEITLVAVTKFFPASDVRLLADLDELPRTATTKVVKRELAAQGPVAGRGRLLERDERGTAYADVTEVTDVAEVLDQV
mgnify:CR=1 FL=1